VARLQRKGLLRIVRSNVNPFLFVFITCWSFCYRCSHTFKFTPQYAPDAPDYLPMHEVLFILTKKIVCNWCPFLFRVLMVLTLWLAVVPWSTW
jgi:hypothetical protein